MLGTLDNAMQWTDRDGNSEIFKCFLMFLFFIVYCNLK